MKSLIHPAIALLGGLALSGVTIAAPTVYNNEASFLAAAGPTTTYGFEVNTVVENAELASPIAAASLANSFDVAQTGLNSFQIENAAGSPYVVAGTRDLFTHSQFTGPSYSLTFSNFGGTSRSIRAFGLTVVDFASNLGPNDISTIDYAAGAFSGNLLTVIGGQADYTQNFVGVIVDPAEAFTSITLTLNDVASGFQSFDEVIYSAQARLPEPGTAALMVFAVAAGLGFSRRR